MAFAEPATLPVLLSRGPEVLPFTSKLGASAALFLNTLLPCVADMLDRTQPHVRRPTSLLEWHRWFAWYPVPVVRKGKLRYAWPRFVQRKWGTSRLQRHNEMALSAPCAL